MPGPEEGTRPDLLRLTSQIVASHVKKNAVPTNDLPGLIKVVHQTLADVSGEGGDNGRGGLRPAVPIPRSIRPDHIVCLEDGQKFKMLKRHLASDHDLTPDEYRERWGLRKAYPMVAPNYAKRRSLLAKKIGLGKKR
jgi:predicted transcriptional regulator